MWRRDSCPPVDHQLSIARQRLVYAKWQRWDYLAMRLFYIIVLLVCFYGCVDALFATNTLTALFLFPIGAYLAVNLYYQNKLVKVKGSGTMRDREDAKRTLRGFYSDTAFNASTDNVLRDVNFGGYFFDPSWDIIVLLDNDDVYFHISGFGKWNTISPLFGRSNYLKCQKIAASFQQLQQDPTLTL